MGQSFLQALLISSLQLLYLVGVIIAVGFLLGYLENRSNWFLMNTFGSKAILATAWIGTPIHELGHAIMCVIFRHKVVKVKFLQLNDPEGVLGYVHHSYSTRSVYQRMGTFFIGLAPVFSGISALIILMYFLVPDSYEVFSHYLSTNVEVGQVDMSMISNMFLSSITIFKSLFSVSNFLNPMFWLFIVLAISISSHIALSRADIKESYHGLTVMFGVLVIWNIVAGFLGINSQEIILTISKYNAYVVAFSSIAIVFSSLTLGVSYLLYVVRKIH